jgi:hypothetical protein
MFAMVSLTFAMGEIVQMLQQQQGNKQQDNYSNFATRHYATSHP